MDIEERKKLEAQGIVFHYDRERRLENQPRIKAMYEKQENLPKGFFNVLKAAPGGKFLIITIIMLMAVIVLLGIFNRTGEDKIAGVPVSITAFSFEDQIYTTLKFDAAENITQGVISAEIAVMDSQSTIIDKKVYEQFYDGSELVIRTIFTDFDITRVVAVVRFNGEEKTIHTAISK